MVYKPHMQKKIFLCFFYKNDYFFFKYFFSICVFWTKSLSNQIKQGLFMCNASKFICIVLLVSDMCYFMSLHCMHGCAAKSPCKNTAKADHISQCKNYTSNINLHQLKKRQTTFQHKQTRNKRETIEKRFSSTQTHN